MYNWLVCLVGALPEARLLQGISTWSIFSHFTSLATYYLSSFQYYILCSLIDKQVYSYRCELTCCTPGRISFTKIKKKQEAYSVIPVCMRLSFAMGLPKSSMYNGIKYSPDN